MKKIIFTLFTVFLFSSCAVTKNGIIGEFKGKEGVIGGWMTLSLNNNQSFDLNWLSTNYTGRWETVEKKQILLKFDEITDLSLFVRSGVILDSVKEIRFMNKKKIIMDYNSILKRQK